MNRAAAPARVFRGSALLPRQPKALVWLFLGLFIPTGAATAQDPAPGPLPQVFGVVAEPGPRPVLGALVILETPDGRRVRSVLTDGDGRFRLPAPAPGTYRLRVERLGYRAVLTGAFPLAAGERLAREVELTEDPIRLQAVDVVAAARRRCSVSPQEGSLLADLWEQASQAFRRVEATDVEGGYRFQLQRFVRSVEIPTGRVLEETPLPGGAHRRSFQSAPVDELLREGWVRRGEGTDLQYFGPDLSVLLSPEFQRAFCFRVRAEGDRPERVGIAFEPEGRTSVPSIRGTLWMDRESMALEALEFHYTRHLLSPEMPPSLHELFGGEVGFRALPDGRWVVERWVLRMPEFRRTGGVPTDLRVRGREDRGDRESVRLAVQRAPRAWQEMIRDGRLRFREEGGMVESIRTRAGTLLPGRGEAVLAGVVRDSLGVPGAPLAGARIRILGAELEDRTSPRGRFRITGPLDGVYQVVIEHPVLDSLGIGAVHGADVRLRPGLVEEVELALPSRRTVMASPCLDAEQGGGGILVGRVLEGVGRFPLPGAEVRIRPSEEQSGLPSFVTMADAEGVFRFCRVPAGREYDLWAWAHGDEGAPTRFVVAEAGRILQLDARVELAGQGRVEGRIREGDAGPWVVGATLVLEGPDPRTVTSDRNGRFRLEELRPGSYRVRVEHLAYRAVETEFTVPPGDAVLNVELRMLRDAIPLAPIHVEVEARSPRLLRVGYYERQRAGYGNFIEREQIERRRPVRTGDLFHILSRAQVSGGQILFRGQAEIFGALARTGGVTGEDEGGPQPCPARVFVDGVREPDDRVDDIHPDDIEAIEAYAGPARIPVQYSGADSACGVILIWLRDR
jgi:hypothetical protein